MARQKNKKGTGLTCGALFSGIGGFCAGFEKFGFETRWAVDFNGEACATYALNYETEDLREEDVIELNDRSEELSKVDVMHAGFPCQSFSSAGNRKGFDDPRGNLFFEITRLVKRMGDDRPKILVFENAPFLMYGENGAWFDRIRFEIQRAGYWFGPENAFIVDTREHAGLPQRRERLFMVATAKGAFDYNPVFGLQAKPTPVELISLLDLDTETDEYYYLSEKNKYGNWILNEGKKLPEGCLLQLRRATLRLQEPGMCPTLPANMGLGGHNVPFVVDGGRLRKLTETECLRLQGFDDGLKWPPIPISARYRLIGNSVSPRISEMLADRLLDLFK